MSTRPFIPPQPVIVNESMADDIVSEPTILQNLGKGSYGISWSGTSPVGTCSVEVSNDFKLSAQGQVQNAGTWNVLTLNINGTPTTTIPVTGDSGNGFIDIYQTGAYAIRLIYTYGSGTGTMNAMFAAKV